MKVKDILLGFIFALNQFDIVDIKTGEVYFYKSFDTCKNLIGKKIIKMPIIDMTTEDDGRITVWVKWYK